MKTLSALLLTALTALLAMSSFAQSPGELVGYTQYDYQCNFSTGQRIDVDSSGGVHVAWMRTMSYPSPRNVVYAYRDLGGNWTTSDLGSGGWPQIAVSSLNQPGIALHNSLQRLGYWTPLFQDTIPGSGFWPFTAIDRDDRIQCLYASGEFDYRLTYTRSNNGGRDWTVPVPFDTVFSPSFVITASKVSDKVAVVYLHELYDVSSFDIYYIQSLEGLVWDWRNGKINITHNGTTRNAYGNDIDAVYDYNDNLHIIWNFQYYGQGAAMDTAFIYHYDTASGTIIELARLQPDWPVAGCEIGSNNTRMTKMSISASEAWVMAVSYTRFDSTDCSAGGFANGEIYFQYSLDYGANWSPPINVTDSHTPGCDAGNCDSDHWPSMAERIDDYFHIFYVDDKDAGSVPLAEGAVTDNPMRYIRFSLEDLLAEDSGPIPSGFSLSQNYPNPFNARTTISFELKKESLIKLAVYDITGALVEMLADSRLSAGHHSVTWDASSRASGIYYVRLTTNEESSAGKMVLLK